MGGQRSIKSSIRAKLARRFAAIAIGAALAACSVGYAATWVWSESVVRNLATRSTAEFNGESPPMGASAFMSQHLDTYLRERITDVRGWASAPTVVHAAQQASMSREESGMRNRVGEAFESESEVRGSLGQSAVAVADGYLRALIANSRDFHRIRFTDRNGLDVVDTDVRSDVAHAGEDWWQRSWSDGAAVDEVMYDENVDRWVITVSMRIDDPATGKPVGVLQAALGLDSVHDITDRYRERGYGERITVADRDGLLVAETASDHSGSRLMNDEINLRGKVDDAHRAAYEGDRTGQVVEGGWTTGYSRTAGGTFYADAIRGSRFAGFDWVVIMQSASFGTFAGIAGPEKIGVWRQIYAGILGAGFIAIALVAGGVAWWMAGRASRPIRDLHAAAVRMSRGRATGTLRLDTNDELSEVADAFERMRRIIRKAVHMLREQQKDSSA